MLIIVKYEELKDLLTSDLEAWMQVSGGPNLDAFEFDPQIVDKSVLDAKGYYTDRDAWLAGVQIKKVQKYLQEQLSNPVKASQNS